MRLSLRRGLPPRPAPREPTDDGGVEGLPSGETAERAEDPSEGRLSGEGAAPSPDVERGG
jgi:hypothetical protein